MHSIVESVTAQPRWFPDPRATTMRDVSTTIEPRIADDDVTRALRELALAVATEPRPRDEPRPSAAVFDEPRPRDEPRPSAAVFDEPRPRDEPASSEGVFDEPHAIGPRGQIAAEPRKPALVRGLGAVAVLVAASFALAALVPNLSPLLVALALGLVVSPFVRRARDTEPGVAFAARSLLRAGVALLGLRIALGDLASLGASGVVLAAATLAATFGFTVWLGGRLGVARGATLLIAAGCSICGAAAIAAMRPVTDASEEDVGRAVAAVGVLGTLAMLLVPVLGGGVLGLSEERTGMWAGASIHEVAQVTAAGAAVSVAALKTATLVKLVRVVLLAPVVAVAGRGASAPPVPPFVLAFLALVLARTVVPLPQELLDAAAVASLVLLAAGMGALGLQIRPRSLVAGGARPLLLAVAATGCALLTGLVLVAALP
jgi:uncharacterized integral membrane protein (TIGR00698 family)